MTLLSNDKLLEYLPSLFETDLKGDYKASVLAGDERDAWNSVETPNRVTTHEECGKLESGLILKPYTFSVYRFK